jgi:RNase P subunit RPR2
MHKALDEWKNEINSISHAWHYHPICKSCNTELFMSEDEFNIEKKSQKSQDDILSYKCPICGKINKITRDELYEFVCSYFGDKNIRFTLDEKETKDAKEFIKEHNHKEEFLSQRKMGFSTLGQQFSYIITPGGLGNSVEIRCNHCHKTKDITNTDNW